MILKKPAHVPHICMVGILQKLKDGPLSNIEVLLELPSRYQLKNILTRTSSGMQVMLEEKEDGLPFKHYFVEERWSMDYMELIRKKTVLIKATFIANGFYGER